MQNQFKLFQVFKQFMKFGIVGFISTILSYLIFVVMTHQGIHYFVANATAFVITVFVSHTLNYSFVFKKQENEQRNWLQTLGKAYISYAGTTLILSSILLWIQIDLIGIPDKIAPLINLGITVPINFCVNKFWSYKKAR